MNFLEAIWKSLVLGTVQGLTEFLPVSSSGHLSLLQRALGYGVAGRSMTFVNVMLHVGTLVSVLIVFRRDVAALFARPFRNLLLLGAATVPAGAVGLLFHEEIDALFAGQRGLLYLAVSFAATALLLLACEIVVLQRRRVRPLGAAGAAVMGIAQAAALFPGISRSGATIAAGTFCGVGTKDAANFSFLMSIPVILGSFLVELKGIAFERGALLAATGAADLVGVAVGIAAAAVSGYFAIRFMLRLVAKANYKWFALYLAALSLTCFWLNALSAF